MRRFILPLFLLVGLLVTVRLPVRSQVAPPTRIRDVIYQKRDGFALTMDVFKPEKPNGAAVLYMVSGGWVSNHEGINPGIAALFTKRGYTVFEVVHGSQPRFNIPDILPDIHRAVRFVRAHATEYSIDPGRIGISGSSAGGHLSLMLGLTGGPGKPNAPDPIDRESSKVQAVACFFPPTDFLNWGKTGVTPADLPSLQVFWPAMRIHEGMTAKEKDDTLRPISPIYVITPACAPTRIIHGEADKLVPVEQSQRFIAELKKAGVPCQLDVIPGKDHGWPGMEKDAELLVDWFDKYLTKK